MGSASDFLKMLPKFKMAARGQIVDANTQSREINQILLSHSPRYGDVQVIFFKVSLKFKMAAMDKLNICL